MNIKGLVLLIVFGSLLSSCMKESLFSSKIEGTVKGTTTGNSIEGARIELVTSESQGFLNPTSYEFVLEVYTNAKGEFSIPPFKRELGKGYNLFCSHPLYKTRPWYGVEGKLRKEKVEFTLPEPAYLILHAKSISPFDNLNYFESDVTEITPTFLWNDKNADTIVFGKILASAKKLSFGIHGETYDPGQRIITKEINVAPFDTVKLYIEY